MVTTEATDATRDKPRLAKVGWGILISVSALLIIAGVGWFFSLPQMMQENIVEYGNLNPGDLMQGQPSAVDVITLIARGYGVAHASLGLLGLLVGMEGYRNGTRWAWIVMWVLVFAYVAIATIFMLPGDYAPGIGSLVLAVIALIGMLLARRTG